jgi:hypothetical protein
MMMGRLWIGLSNDARHLKLALLLSKFVLGFGVYGDNTAPRLSFGGMLKGLLIKHHIYLLSCL